MARSRIAREALSGGRGQLTDPHGVYLGPAAATSPQIAFLFPGQGSQYPGMHRDLAIHFPVLRQTLELADHETAGTYARRLSSYVFPPPAFTKQDQEAQQRHLTDTVVAQPALGAVEVGLCRLLAQFGVRPDFAAGHSYGEYAALWCADVFSTETLFALSAARGRLIKQATGDSSGTMAAVGAAPESIERVIANDPALWIANLNAPRQTVLAGSVEAIERAIAQLTAAGISARRIPVACAFHSPLVQPAQREFAALLARTSIRAPRIPVFSNALAAPYPRGAEEIRDVLSEHLVRPVRFVEEIRAMQAAGADVFVEVGPRSVLSNLARESLSGRDALILPVDASDKPGVVQLLHTLGQLFVAGVRIDHQALVHGRSVGSGRLEDLAGAGTTLGSHIWMVNGGRSRRLAVGTKDGVRSAESRAVTSVPAGSNGGEKQLNDVVPRPLPSIRTADPASNVTRAAPTGSIPSNTGRSSNGGSMESQSSPVFGRPPGDHEDVMRQFQHLMSQFLQTQAMVMTAYLHGTPRTAHAPVSLPLPPPAAQPRLESPQPAVPPVAVAAAQRSLAAAPTPGVSAPAARGSIEPAHPDLSSAVVRPASMLREPGIGGNGKQSPAPADVLQQLVAIVSERTGYPEDMLDVNANMEADLGIDSIKRMEVLTAFQQLHADASRGGFQEAMEHLTSLKTLREMATTLTDLLKQQAEVAAIA